MSNVPTLTKEERLRNLELAKAARQERAVLRQKMKAGQVSLADAMSEPCAQRMYVRQLLASLPGIAQSRAEGIMRRLDIAPSRRVHGLGPRQRERLADYFDKRDQ